MKLQLPNKQTTISSKNRYNVGPLCRSPKDLFKEALKYKLVSIYLSSKYTNYYFFIIYSLFQVNIIIISLFLVEVEMIAMPKKLIKFNFKI